VNEILTWFTDSEYGPATFLALLLIAAALYVWSAIRRS
jgi:hypothetical protein